MPRFTRRALAGLAATGATVPLARLSASDPVENDLYRLQRPWAVPRPLEQRLSEVVYITDFGAVEGNSIAPAVHLALTSLGMDNPASLVFPKGNWSLATDADWSAYRNVTLRFEPGALVSHGGHAVILPERVEIGLGAGFAGTGAVTQKNVDETPLAEPPGGYIRVGNEARGLRALHSNVGGHNNFAWGVDALASAEHVRSSVAIGNRALSSVVGDATGARGQEAPGYPGSYFALGDANLAIGDFALQENTTGFENIALGAYSLRDNTTGQWNAAIGPQSQITGTNGSCNVSLGAYALVVNEGNNNLAIGWAALEGQTTGSNIAIGHVAMNANVSGNLNTAIGSEALMRSKTGNYNVCVGIGTLTNLVSGNSNTGIGSYALSSAQGNATDNTAVGRDALLLLMTGNGNTAVGSRALGTLKGWDNCTGLGTGAAVTGSNQVQLGNSHAVPHAFAPLQLRSDERDKADIRDTRLGLSFIRALRPVDFRWNLRDDYNSAEAVAAGTQSQKRQRYHHGLVAQEVRDVINRTGTDFGGFQDHARGGGEDVLSLGYAELIAPLIKAVQELASEVETLKGEVAELRNGKRSA
ncbi:tail fiber domain-containing protein [Altericroceibacterium xinjiangense]|uniref:tail fiber domain-containing protein n=1 Tax=Altericroceibacterium xinjiangense TaxID=762261 RepID=UPI000F7D816A|nr:tail fiber domain-containing protein [Altericroceibacterium xinjiangense]